MPKRPLSVVTIGDARLIVDPDAYSYVTLPDGRIGMLDVDNGGRYHIPPQARDMLDSYVAMRVQLVLDDLNSNSSRADEELLAQVRVRAAMARGAQLGAVSIHGPIDRKAWKHDAPSRPSWHDTSVALRKAMGGHLIVDIPPGFNDIMEAVAVVWMTETRDCIVRVDRLDYMLGTGAELDALQEAAYTKRLGTQITAREFRNMAAAWVNNKRRKALDDDGMQA